MTCKKFKLASACLKEGQLAQPYVETIIVKKTNKARPLNSVSTQLQMLTAHFCQKSILRIKY